MDSVKLHVLLNKINELLTTRISTKLESELLRWLTKDSKIEFKLYVAYMLQMDTGFLVFIIQYSS